MLVRSRKEELLRELQRLGCVELTEPAPELQEAQGQSPLRPESSEANALRTKQAVLEHAVELLDRYAPAKGKLLAPKPELEGEELLSGSGVEEALHLAGAIAAADERVRRIGAEENRLRALIEALQPWTALELPLSMEGTERAALLSGSVSSRIALNDVAKALEEAADEAELFSVAEDKNARYLLLVCAREQLAAAQEALRGFGFTASAFGDLKGTAAQEIESAGQSLTELAEEKSAWSHDIAGHAAERDALKLASDRVGVQLAAAEAEERLCGTESTLVLEGWMPAEREEELAALLERYECAWELSDPEKDEYEQVPVQLKNNSFTNALNMVTNMYSLPAYGSVDPNPLMAPFFILFYGLMMADMGYGALMVIAALVAMKKIRPRAGTLAFCQLLLYAGISTFIMGALTGGLFGDAPYRIVHMFNPSSTWEGLPYLFNPLAKGGAEPVLYGAMVLGLIHLNVGMIVSAVEKVRKGDPLDAVFEEGPLWVILLGGILYALSALHIAPISPTPGLVVLIVGAAALLFGAGRHAKGFGKVTAAVGCVYNTATGWFGDVLSYSRIMALMLAGSVVGQVFNTIAAMPAESSGVNLFTILVFILIFLVGHAMNFALNLLGCFVHDLRLQCLEFFGKFYQDGGRPFQPLKIRTKYVQAKEN